LIFSIEIICAIGFQRLSARGMSIRPVAGADLKGPSFGSIA
jgi:hypothetical protein